MMDDIQEDAAIVVIRVTGGLLITVAALSVYFGADPRKAVNLAVIWLLGAMYALSPTSPFAILVGVVVGADQGRRTVARHRHRVAELVGSVGVAGE